MNARQYFVWATIMFVWLADLPSFLFLQKNLPKTNQNQNNNKKRTLVLECRSLSHRGMWGGWVAFGEHGLNMWRRKAFFVVFPFRKEIPQISHSSTKCSGLYSLSLWMKLVILLKLFTFSVFFLVFSCYFGRDNNLTCENTYLWRIWIIIKSSFHIS